MKHFGIGIILLVTVFLKAGCAAAREHKSEVKACCTRAMLQKAVDSYVAAQAAGDIAKMDLALHVNYMENMEKTT